MVSVNVGIISIGPFWRIRLWKAGDDRSKMTVEKVRMLEEVGFVWRLQF